MRWLLPVLLLCSTAWAGPAEDAAARAKTVADAHCADTAGPTATLATALAQVAPALEEVSRVYESMKPPYLLYWRGVLLACMGRDAEALGDLQTFASDKGNQRFLAVQVQDAERRLRYLRRKTGAKAPRPGPAFGPFATVGVGGGWDGRLAPGEGHHYGGVGVDGSIRIVGPLRAVVFGRFAWGAPREVGGQTERSALVPFGAGLAARVGDGAALLGSVRFEASPNAFGDHGGALLPGVTGALGGAFQLGPAPLEVQPAVFGGVLGRYGHLGASVSVAVRLGS